MDYERDKISPRVDVLQKIATELQETVGHLIGEVPQEFDGLERDVLAAIKKHKG